MRDPGTRATRLLTVGSLPPELGGPERGGVATFHAALLEGLSEWAGEIEVVGVMPPGPLAGEPPFPVFTRPDNVGIADFYEDTLSRLEPDVVLMNHVAHTVGVTHARLADPPPALGIAHSWHNITFRAGEERVQAQAVTEEALAGLAALVTGSRHCLEEGRSLGLRYPRIAEAIHYPLQQLYLDANIDVDAGNRDGVLFLGSLIPRKNPESLVEASELLPGVEILLAGEGELRDQLGDSIAQRGIGDRVRIASHFPPFEHLERIRALLLGAQVMCLPSSSESFGLVFIEALACGTPVVGFGPTVREIRDELGIAIGEPLEENSPAAIADAIERVLAVEWDRPALRRAATTGFGLRRTTDRYTELLTHVATQGLRFP